MEAITPATAQDIDLRKILLLRSEIGQNDFTINFRGKLYQIEERSRVALSQLKCGLIPPSHCL